MTEDKWRIIDTHLNSMMEFTNGMSPNMSMGQAQNQRQGHIHRRSEPDVVMIRRAQQLGKNAVTVPQSAPVQPGTFTLDWNSKPKLPSCEDETVEEDIEVISGPVNLGQFPELEAFGANPPTSHPQTLSTRTDRGIPHGLNHHHNIPEVNHNSGFLGVDKPDPPPRPPPYTRVSGLGHNRSSRPSLPCLVSEIPFNKNHMFMSIKNPPINNNYGYQSPRTNRRSSMPGNQLDSRAHSASPNITRRSTSIQPMAAHRRKTQDNFVFVPTLIQNPEISPVPTHPSLFPVGSSKADDTEYTKALLQHQRERMERLRRELETKRELLTLLANAVSTKEKEVFEKQNEKISTSMPTIADVTKLRDLNRKMEIECNCMIKEVDMVTKSGNSVNENFHEHISRKNPSGEFMNQQRSKQRTPRNSITTLSIASMKIPHANGSDTLPSPPLPPPPPPPVEEEEAKWSCKWCTYDNHPALNKCEICDYRRDRVPTAS